MDGWAVFFIFGPFRAELVPPISRHFTAKKGLKKIQAIKGVQIKTLVFVKLHSELALPTESQLDRVGVDFIFPRYK